MSSSTQKLTEEEIDRLVATAIKDAAHRRMEILDIAREAGINAPLSVIEAAFESRGFGRYPETKVTKEEFELIKAGKHWSQTEEGKAWAKANSEVRDASGNIIKPAGTVEIILTSTLLHDVLSAG
ncbi:uncharacterized protein H6S33_002188 [Morchella sextelata]|uniref:uncharacterized protein n=1 Tax=Morchella sextelata TaxID=1174677 RepID=UPI001D04EA27|nr:uncharacterized protein H6S33_002188 [Morchella sextelata]KAH0608136.1 hypothetical protein H6S33_002188 [Morchella sextelata]